MAYAVVHNPFLLSVVAEQHNIFALVTLIGSVSSAAQTQECSPPLLLLLREVVGLRIEVEGWGDGIIDTQRMWIRCPRENPRVPFQNVFTLRPGFKKSAFTGSIWMISQNDAKHVRLHKKLFPCG